MTEAVEDAAVSDTGLRVAVVVAVEIGIEVKDIVVFEAVGAMVMIEVVFVCMMGECKVGIRRSGDMGVWATTIGTWSALVGGMAMKRIELVAFLSDFAQLLLLRWSDVVVSLE